MLQPRGRASGDDWGRCMTIAHSDSRVWGQVRWLLVATVTWNVVEGVVAVSAGLAAGSVALVGFGLDSFIEVAAAAVLLWRMSISADDDRTERRETAARRVVGVTFLVLALYILGESVYVLAFERAPEPSRVGIILSAISLAVMPAIGILKRGRAVRLESPALVAESTETLICSYLSLALLAGLVANSAAGWWWADVAAALAMIPWITKEGVEGLRGDPD